MENEQPSVFWEVADPFILLFKVRFRRLRDLLDLYALSEVEEFIKQKESLVTAVPFTITPDSSLC